MELLLQTSSADRLALWEGRQSQRQRKEGGRQDQTQVDGEDHARTGAQPCCLLQADQDQRWEDHDGCSVQHTTDGRFADGEGRGLLGLAQTLDGLGIVTGLLALDALCVRENGVDVDTAADLLATHQEDVQSAGAGDSREGDEPGKDETGVGGDTLETGDEGVQAEGDRAGSGDGHEVGFGYLRSGEWGGLVCVGIVDRNVEGLVADLPEEGAGGLDMVN